MNKKNIRIFIGDNKGNEIEVINIFLAIDENDKPFLLNKNWCEYVDLTYFEEGVDYMIKGYTLK